MSSLRSPRLPAELLDQVASSLLLAELRAFSLCSKLFSEIAGPYMFCTMDLDQDCEGISWCLELPERQRVALAVRHFIAQEVGEDHWVSQVLARSLRSMPRLRRFSFDRLSRVVLQEILDHPRLDLLSIPEVQIMQYDHDAALRRPPRDDGWGQPALRLKSFRLTPPRSIMPPLCALADFLCDLGAALGILIIGPVTEPVLQELVLCPSFSLHNLSLSIPLDDGIEFFDRVWCRRILQLFPRLFHLALHHSPSESPSFVAINSNVLSVFAQAEIDSPFHDLLFTEMSLQYEGVGEGRVLVGLVAEAVGSGDQWKAIVNLSDVLRFFAMTHPTLKVLELEGDRFHVSHWPSSSIGLPQCLTILGFSSCVSVLPDPSFARALASSWREAVGDPDDEDGAEGGLKVRDPDDLSDFSFEAVLKSSRASDFEDFLADIVDGSALNGLEPEHVKLPTARVRALASLMPSLEHLHIGFESAEGGSSVFDSCFDPQTATLTFEGLISPDDDVDLSSDWLEDEAALLDHALQRRPALFDSELNFTPAFTLDGFLSSLFTSPSRPTAPLTTLSSHHSALPSARPPASPSASAPDDDRMLTLNPSFKDPPSLFDRAPDFRPAFKLDAFFPRVPRAEASAKVAVECVE